VGCDIHSYGERREGNRWVCVRASLTPRWFGEEKIIGADPAPSGPEPFDAARKYRHFAFLAGVRNQWGVPPIVEPRGLPEDASAYVRYAYWDSHRRGEKRDSWHSESWLTVEELTAFDYDRTFENHAPILEIDGNPCYEEGLEDAAHGRRMKTYQEFLGPEFLNLLGTLKAARIERVVFWFDN
jgi:hypothetical protein